MAQYVGVGSLGRIVAELGVFKRNLECIRTTCEAPEQETPPCVVHSRAIIILAGRSHISDQNVKFWAISN